MWYLLQGTYIYEYNPTDSFFTLSVKFSDYFKMIK